MDKVDKEPSSVAKLITNNFGLLVIIVLIIIIWYMTTLIEEYSINSKDICKLSEGIDKFTKFSFITDEQRNKLLESKRLKLHQDNIEKD